jgi:hypothetical protein
MTVLRRVFTSLPPGARAGVLHRMGRYAPWEEGFDFTPPALQPGEESGPPDFVGIGVQKAGTTWWFELLATHPGVSARADLHKERHFFDRFAAQPFTAADATAYHAWFPRPPGAVTGEWTPDYCTYPWVPELLQQAAPDARLLVLLRDPVDRFFSGLAHQARAGRARDGIAMADAVQRGFYLQALQPWWDRFGEERVLVLQYERCVADLRGQLARTFEFLGLTEYHVSDVEMPRSSEGSMNPAAADPDAVRRLVGLYAGEVEALATRLPHLDLSLWPNFSYLSSPGVPASSPTRRP